MAEMFMAITAAVSSAGSSVMSFFSGAGASAGAGAAASTGSGILSLSNIMSAGSALAAIGQGVAAKREAGVQAAFAETQGFQEKAAGASQASNLSREYAQLRGEQQVIQLANGLDIGVGTPVNIAEATQRQADRDLTVMRDNARNRASIQRMRSRSLLAEGRAAMTGSLIKSGQYALEAYQQTA